MSMSHSFAPTFYMPEGIDPYDMAVVNDLYPTSLAEAIMALDTDDFAELCARADVSPYGELAWYEAMEWVRTVVNDCVPYSRYVRVSISLEEEDYVTVYAANYREDV